MSTINPYPTFQYSQPREYHFSHDSVFLARRVFEYLDQNIWNPRTALDLCSGCGIVGLDLLFHLRSADLQCPLYFDFLDVQEEYKKHFEENKRRLGEIATTCRFVSGNYADILSDSLEKTYDLIVCNPPYFSKNQGKHPATELKLRSRFFIDSELDTLIEFVERKISVEGIAFILIREQKDHKQNQIEKVRRLGQGSLTIELLDDIRGTSLLLLKKLAVPELKK